MAMSSDGKPIHMSLGMTMQTTRMPPSGTVPDARSTLSDSRGNLQVPHIAQFVRYNGWPELKESFIAGQVKAAMLLAPMAMDLADKGIPARIVALGHRSGAVIMVRKESAYRTFADLKGKRIAIPSRFAVDHLFVRRLMKEQGLQTGDVTLV